MTHAPMALRANVTIAVIHRDTGSVETQRLHNLVVSAGRNLVRDLLANASSARLTHFAIGTGTAAVTAADTTLGTEVFRDALTSLVAADGKLTASYYLSSASANGNTLSEIGLLTANSGGTLYARALLASTIAKTSSIAVTFTWELTFGV